MENELKWLGWVRGKEKWKREVLFSFFSYDKAQAKEEASKAEKFFIYTLLLNYIKNEHFLNSLRGCYSQEMRDNFPLFFKPPASLFAFLSLSSTSLKFYLLPSREGYKPAFAMSKKKFKLWSCLQEKFYHLFTINLLSWLWKRKKKLKTFLFPKKVFIFCPKKICWQSFSI